MSPDNKTKEEYVKNYFQSAIKRKTAEVKREKWRQRAQSFNKIGGGAIKAFAKGRATQLRTVKMIRKPIPLSSGGKYYYQGEQLVRSRVKFGRGRPKGSYAPEYQNFGGVYNYRKFMSQQRALERAEAMRHATVSPEQQEVLARFAAQQRARQINPENQTIANTYGNVPLKSIHDEINDAANIIQ